MVKKQLLGALVLATCFCPAPGAQVRSKPDLSGTWVVDKTRSEKSDNPLEDSETSVTIQQNDPEIRMVRRFSSAGGAFEVPLVYYSDQRGQDYKDPATGQSLKSKTKWDGDKLVRRSVVRRIIMGRIVDVDMIEEWKLSKDGQTLTRKMIYVFPRNAPDRVNAVPVAQPTLEIKKVYNRESQ
jgi:hypothetical protein